MNDSGASWPAAWIRASLDVAVLASLARGPRHGYAIAQELAEHGFGLLKGGSLYPALNRMEASGALEATWVEGSGGPGRREYSLTEAGRQQLEADLATWRSLGETIAAMSRPESRRAEGDE